MRLFSLTAISGLAALAQCLAVTRADTPPDVPATGSTRAVARLPAIGHSAEVPSFQPGLWEYRRTVTGGAQGKPQVLTVKKCSDPTEEIKQKSLQLKQKGCLGSSLVQTRNRYHTSWVCPVSGGRVEVRDVVTVSSPGSYEDSNEIHNGVQTTRNTIVATRLGDCPASPENTTKAPTR